MDPRRVLPPAAVAGVASTSASSPSRIIVRSAMLVSLGLPTVFPWVLTSVAEIVKEWGIERAVVGDVLVGSGAQRRPACLVGGDVRLLCPLGRLVAVEIRMIEAFGHGCRSCQQAWRRYVRPDHLPDEDNGRRLVRALHGAVEQPSRENSAS